MVLVVASRRWMGGWGVGVVVLVKGDLPRSLPIVRPEQDFSTYCDRDFFGGTGVSAGVMSWFVLSTIIRYFIR